MTNMTSATTKMTDRIRCGKKALFNTAADVTTERSDASKLINRKMHEESLRVWRV